MSWSIDDNRLCLAYGGSGKGWDLHQMDVKNTFPQGNLEEYVYMVQLLGFQSALNKSAVYQLKKSLYGLEQTPRASNA